MEAETNVKLFMVYVLETIINTEKQQGLLMYEQL